MAGFSQNGWSVIGSADLDKTQVAGVSLAPGVRKGDVSVILRWVATEFHNKVENLVPGWCWGFANRPISGSTTLSNHASGTAIDLNAPRHPMGKANTFSAVQVSAIRGILSACEGVIRWGGDYTRKDEMHFEINASAARVATLAAKLSGQPAPKPPAPTPAPVPSKQTVFLPSAQDTWRLYDVNTAPIAGREKATLRPSKFPPGLTYDIRAWHDGGTTVEIQTQQFGVGKIYVKGTVAQIKSGNTPTPAPSPKPTETIRNGTWNVRSGPSVSSGVIGVARGGQRYQTTKVAGNWRQITFSGRTGYVGPAAWA